MKNKVISFIILCISLFFLSFVFLSIKGKTYEARIDQQDFSNYSINDIQTTQEGNNVTLIDKRIENGVIILKYRALSKGKTIVELRTDEYYNYIRLFVHDFKIITYEEYFGDCNGDEVIAISFTIIILYLLILICTSFKKSIKENLYQYKNM